MQGIKRVLEVIVKLLPDVEALRSCKAHVIRIEGIGHHQLRRGVLVVPIRQIIGITVCVVDETALFGDQPVRLRTATTQIPA